MVNQAVENGFLLVFACSVLAGGGWALIRLLGKNGIGSTLCERLIQFLTHMEGTTDRLADSAELLQQGLDSNTAKIEELINLHRDPNSALTANRLIRAGRHVVKVLEHVAIKLDCYENVKPSLDKILSELTSKPRQKDEE